MLSRVEQEKSFITSGPNKTEQKVERAVSLYCSQNPSCWPHGFREELFRGKSNQSMGANDPMAWSIAPNGKVVRIYVGDHSTLLHRKYVNCGSNGFRENFNSYKPTYPAT